MPRFSKPAARIHVEPVTPERWADFEQLFGARGAPHYCWCTPYRFRQAHEMTHDGKRDAMHSMVTAGTPIGVLAYEGRTPVGWCSIAPRESYIKLERSRTMPRVSTARTWTVLCFFVPRARRRQGIPGALLGGAVDCARAAGAEVIEGYPYDTAGISSTHRGHSEIFRAAGFRRDGTRWSLTMEG